MCCLFCFASPLNYIWMADAYSRSFVNTSLANATLISSSCIEIFIENLVTFSFPLSLSLTHRTIFSLLEILGHIKINQSTQISRQSVGWTQNNIVGVENDAVFKSVPYFSFLFTFPLSISPPVSQRDNQLKHHNMQHSSLVCSAYGKELSVKISN